MNSEFLMLLPDAIGTVEYFWESSSAMSKHDIDICVDNFTNEAMHALIQRAMYEPGYTPDIGAEFLKSREQARDQISKSGMTNVIKATDLQVGNKECLDFVLRLQNDPRFKGWVNAPLITAYIIETQSILNSIK